MAGSLPYPDVRCFHPQEVYNHTLKQWLRVPCGKCPACKLRMNSRLSKQIRLEASTSHKVLFITLTFANTYIPRMYVNTANMVNTCVDSESGEVLGEYIDIKDNTDEVKRAAYLFDTVPFLRKKDYQMFMDRLRDYLRRYCKDNKVPYEKIRYFVCGEYGPKHFRPHFHILLFLESDLYAKVTEHTLSEFPSWSWSQREDNPPKGTDKLSVCEYYIRKSWNYGIIDCDYTKGDCSSYVAGYVNSIGNLPRIFQQEFCRPFVAHSSFLGYKFCKAAREKVYAATPACFMREGITNAPFASDNQPIRTCFNVFYPKCNGYANKTAQQRITTYRSYLWLRTEFPEVTDGRRSLLSVSLELAMYLIEYRQKHSFPLDDGCSLAFRSLLEWLYDDIVVRANRIEAVTDVELMTQRIYTRMLLSRHFIMFVCNGDTSMRASKLYVDKIEEFYNYLEISQLGRFYETQRDYFFRDYAMPCDIVMFYDSVEPSVSELRVNPEYSSFLEPSVNIKDSKAYQLFQLEISDKIRKKMQTKLHNDKAGLFLNSN